MYSLSFFRAENKGYNETTYLRSITMPETKTQSKTHFTKIYDRERAALIDHKINQLERDLKRYKTARSNLSTKGP
jgi:hypothetical protein